MTMLRERQVLRWRVAASLAWSVILLPVCCVVFIVLSQIQILHPIQWLTDSISDLTSSYTIFCLLLISAILGLQCTFLMEYYTVVPSIPCSRLALIGNTLLPHRIVHSLAHVVMGVLASWCCAVMSKGKYQLIVVSCTSLPSEDESDKPSLCLNESHLFQLLCGAFFGYCYSLQYFVHNMNYLSFPSIQQYKYLQFRRCLPLIIKQSSFQSLYFTRNYAILYYLFGNIPRTWIQTALNLHIDRQQPSLDTLRGLLNLTVFYQIWLSGTFLLSAWYMVWIFFRIYTTEARIFPVQTSFAEEAEKCLPFILSSNTLPLVKYLAMQDLVLLSQYSPSRRQEVFSLSQPGGHPHNWTAISKECLNLLSSLTSRLIAHQEAAASNGRMKVPSSPKQTRKSSSSSGVQKNGSEVSNLSPVTLSPVCNGAKQGIFSTWFQHKLDQIKNFLSKRGLIMYLFSKHPEASSEDVFADAQIHIWALEALSHLVAASFSEDRMGVVQTSLSAVLATFFTLQEAVEKHFKLPHASSKPVRNPGSLLDSSYKTLRFSLRAALKTAIYRITTTFGEHLHAVPVSSEHQKKLQQFLDFKE
eukprot:XP_017948546.1 PREDICTED: nucleoporin NDC1 isoform X1 [Xenopus tropicalis]